MNTCHRGLPHTFFVFGSGTDVHRFGNEHAMQLAASDGHTETIHSNGRQAKLRLRSLNHPTDF
eukprot:6463545-Amphidinium_carterae.1